MKEPLPGSWYSQTHTCKPTSSQEKMRTLGFEPDLLLKKEVKLRFKARAFAWDIDFYNSRTKVFYGSDPISNICQACGEGMDTTHLFSCKFMQRICDIKVPHRPIFWKIISLFCAWIKHSEKEDLHYIIKARAL
eukprot:TRINITY_DN274_c0_g3_i2.p1 TRINITY_DN274_c0_g3~~TRINITY_DN274_c0_g3_i2.p1  ORF type:complete len:134 (-),score=16.72 TRINITY_DN274_c0_g3_i2:650-1051(-)